MSSTAVKIADPIRRDFRKWFALAVVISLLFHFLLFELAGLKKINGPAYYDHLLGRGFKVQRVEMDPPNPLDIPKEVTRTPGTSAVSPQRTLETPPAFPDVKKVPTSKTAAPAPSAVKIAVKKTPVSETALPQAERDTSVESRQTAEVLAIQEENLKENISVEKRPLRETQPATATDRNALPEPAGIGTEMPKLAIDGEGTRQPLAPGSDRALASPIKGQDSGTGLALPSSTPFPEVERAKLVPMREGDRLLREDVSGQRPYEQINPLMEIELFKYEETKHGRLEGYFMLRITAKENNVLKVIPKDVFFVVDSSSSIGKGRLFEFKSGVTRSLKDLNAQDRFNLLVFKKRPEYFSKEFSPMSPAMLADVKRFFSDIYSEGRTDIFRALFPMTELPREKNRMRMALLMSDGNANEGERNATRIINQFTERNERSTSLFSLSGGKKVNQFLLEFLSYQNQGLSLDVARENNIGPRFHDFYLKIRDPLLMDLDFKFAGVAPEEIYPRNLPHIYQNTPLQIYGRYDPETQKLFTMQILGQSFGVTKELLTRQSFEDAKMGTRQIALNWGRQKTYHLVGQTLRDDSPALQKEISRISREYDVDVSFLQ